MKNSGMTYNTVSQKTGISVRTLQRRFNKLKLNSQLNSNNKKIK